MSTLTIYELICYYKVMLSYGLPHPLAKPVIETLEQHELDASRFILDRESTLAIFGLRAAHHVSMIVHPSYFENLQTEGLTPGGVALERPIYIPPYRQRLVSPGNPEDGLLPLDIATFKHLGATARFEFTKRASYSFNPRSLLDTMHTVRPYYVLNQITPAKTTFQKQDRELINNYYDRVTGITV
jgi:hypothetical protein